MIKHKIALKTVGFRFEWSIVQKIIILGLPSFIMNTLNAFTVTIVNLFLVAYSDTSIAFGEHILKPKMQKNFMSLLVLQKILFAL